MGEMKDNDAKCVKPPLRKEPYRVSRFRQFPDAKHLTPNGAFLPSQEQGRY